MKNKFLTANYSVNSMGYGTEIARTGGEQKNILRVAA
jgi:hypothetical protein